MSLSIHIGLSGGQQDVEQLFESMWAAFELDFWLESSVST